jgi:3-methyladenine DNA glycosylase AlkD
MSAAAIIEELRALGSEGYKRIILRHGASEPCFGVKIEELKKIQKRIRKDYGLSLELYKSGIYDAMYLAGLIADDGKMTKKNLQEWVESARGPLAGSTVSWVAAGSPHGREMALRWIDSTDETVAGAGWTTLSSLVSIKDDADLDLAELKKLLRRVEQTILQAPNGVRYAMNGFIISVGAYVAPLSELARQTGEKIGPVTVDMGDTACKVPFAPDYIRKVEQRRAIGKKRKSAKC